MRIGDVRSQRAFLMGPDRHCISLGHVEDLARARAQGDAVARHRDTPLEDDHDVVDGDLLVDRMVRAIAPITDGDRPAVPLIDEVTREDIRDLPGRSFEGGVRRGEFLDLHGYSLRAAAG